MTAQKKDNSQEVLIYQPSASADRFNRKPNTRAAFALISSMFIASAGVLSVVTPNRSVAETLAMPNKDANSYSPRPPRGITKSEVESRFGAPLSKNGPRGNPPIYYWEYPEYTVYFESNIVIHAVSKEKSLKPQY